MARVGGLLLNLGGPERIKDVGPFLYNLFSDPEIIRLPVRAFQKPLAWLISLLRSSKSQEATDRLEVDHLYVVLQSSRQENSKVILEIKE